MTPSRKPEQGASPESSQRPTPGRPDRRKHRWDFGFRKHGDLDRRAALALGALLVAAWLVAVLYLTLSSYTLLRARHVQALRQELLSLQQENALLEERIGERLWMVIQSVPNLGFVPATHLEFVGP